MKRPALEAILVLLFLCLWASLAGAQEGLPQLVKKIQPAVVTIIAYDVKGKPKGQGSGFFINQEGHFITNYHVLAEASRAEVETADGQRYTVKGVMAKDQAGDLIVAATDDPFAAIGRGSLKISTVIPEVGERVVVVGSPLGLEQTLSEGVVSAIRHIPDFGEILQITAPISHGSSGSPVVNMKGEVVGIATFIMKEGQNLNFAIPATRALALKPGAVKPLNEWKVLSIEPIPEAEAFFRQGLELHWAGKLGKAIETYKQAIRVDPEVPEAHINLGAAYYTLGRYQEAARAFQTAVRLEPENAEWHCRLGATYLMLRKYKESAKILKQAIRLDPDLARARSLLGSAYDGLGRYGEAAEAFKQAIRLNPDYKLAHYNLGIIYLNLRNQAAALEEYKILKALDQEMANDLFNKIYR